MLCARFVAISIPDKERLTNYQMNATWGGFILAIVVAIVGAANYTMLLSIRLAISDNSDKIKEWARTEFAPAKEIDRRLIKIETDFNTLRQCPLIQQQRKGIAIPAQESA